MQIEFPSILLPKTIQSGSIVDITVHQNHAAEQKAEESFLNLQEQILQRYGLHAPSPPVLRLKNATQTSIVLEWDPIDLATSSLRSLSLYKNGVKAGTIPRPLEMTQTKMSGLQINMEFSFFLVLKTSGGTFTSNTVTAKTHEMTNLTGICVTPGVLPPQLRGSLDAAVQRIGAKMTETIQIHTTHFVCTEPRGDQWQKAVDMNIPVVRPEWIEGCEREGKIVGVRGYYLDADPKLRSVGNNPSIQAQSRDSIGASRQDQTSVQSPPLRSGSVPGNQSLPTRGAELRSPKVEGEPGPEVGATPPLPQGERAKQTQKDLPPDPPRPEEEDEYDESEDDDHGPEDPEKQRSGPHAHAEDDEDDDTEHNQSSSHPIQNSKGQKASIEDEKGEDMEEVAL